MENERNFAVFVLTHGRPDRVITLATLDRQGYTGPVYLVIDNEDVHGDRYRRRFGTDRVIEFDKRAIAETFDTADTSDDRRAIVYARNACFGIARDLGLDCFLELDDDYTAFRRRAVDGNVLVERKQPNLDRLFAYMIDFLYESGALTVTFAQGGDTIGGAWGGNYKRGLARKAMNSFFCRTDRPIGFLGRVNEDVNTYVTLGARGQLFFALMGTQIEQTPTQQARGGMTETYLVSGTYVKSFYTVMMAPSTVKIEPMGIVHPRLHHRVNWDTAVPKILNERYRKPDGQTTQAQP